MLKNFISIYGTDPESVVIFSWLIPCANCRDLIVDQFTEDPLQTIRNRVVVFNQQPTINRNTDRPTIDINNIRALRQITRENGIILIGPLQLEHPLRSSTFPRSRGKRDASVLDPKEGWSFQECILNGCGTMLGACATDSRKAGELFIDQMMFAIKDVLSNDIQTELSAIRWIRQNVGKNCKAHMNLEREMKACIKKCRSNVSLFYIGLPFTSISVDSNSSICSDQEFLINPNTQDWSAICGGATEGILCSRNKLDSVTVGGRPGKSICNRRGYSYNWAYASNEDGWDYCCEEQCVDGKCRVGDNRVENCGSVGFLSANEMPCMNDHPCGLHGEEYYWCYISSKEWDYCCEEQCSMGTCKTGNRIEKCGGAGPRTVHGVPCKEDHQCGPHGRDYFWCKTKDGWDYCCNSEHEECARGSFDFDHCNVGTFDTVINKACGGKSTVTIKGKQCREDFPCSTHGYSYYWCYTTASGCYDYCCNPYHDCDKYGQSHNWCYVSQTRRRYRDWNYCCVDYKKSMQKTDLLI